MWANALSLWAKEYVIFGNDASIDAFRSQISLKYRAQVVPALPVAIGSVTKSRGSVMCPVKALAATVNGLAK